MLQDDVFGRTPELPEPATDDLRGSPDGLGSAGAPPPPQSGVGAFAQPTEPGGAPDVFGGSPMAGEFDFIEPDDVSPQSAARSAGFTALLGTLALGTGIAFGGAWGAGAGVLLAGSAANVYRAQKWWGSPDPGQKHEAVVSAGFAALGIVTGGYLAYRAYQARSGAADADS